MGSRNEEMEKIILVRLQEGKRQVDIARELAVSSSTISNCITKMKKRGIEIPNYKRKNKDNRDDAIYVRLLEGKRPIDISRELGISPTTISVSIARMKRKGIEIPDYRRIEVEEKEAEILKRLQERKSLVEIAMELGVSTSFISKYITRMRRKGIKIPDYNKIGKTKRENIILTKLNQGMRQVEIANELGLSQQFISKMIKSMEAEGRIIPDYRKIRLDKRDDVILEKLKEGKTRAEISEELGVSLSVIYRSVERIKRRGIEIPKRKVKKNQKDDVILALLLEGKTQSEIAKELGISQPSISRAKKRMINQGVKIPNTKTAKKNKKVIDKQSKNKMITESAFSEFIVKMIQQKRATLDQIVQMAKYYGLEKQVRKLLNNIERNEEEK